MKTGNVCVLYIIASPVSIVSMQHLYSPNKCLLNLSQIRQKIWDGAAQKSGRNTDFKSQSSVQIPTIFVIINIILLQTILQGALSSSIK